MIRAKYIFVQDDRLYAVYNIKVKPSALRNAALQLAAMRGVEAGATRVAIPEPTSPRTTVLWMRVLPAFKADRAQKLFPKLTQPELAIAIAHVEMRFGLCRCGETSITVSDPIFLPEFDPKNVESFDRRFHAALQQLDVWTLVNAQSRPPYKPLNDALDKLLAELGAYATNIYIKPVYNPALPCLHGDSEGR